MLLKQLHHVAYRCNNANETVKFYTEVLGLKYIAAVTSDTVPSTKERCPFFHIFLAMDDGSCVAFFEVPECKPMGRDPNTPEWVQHLALRVDDMNALNEIKRRAQSRGLKCIGPIDHGATHSIYFFDPNGHRLEIAVLGDPAVREEQQRTADAMLRAWDEKWHQGIQA